MYNGSPKPLRPMCKNPIFVEDTSYTVKAMSPIQKQRYADGSQHTKRPLYSLPVSAPLYIDTVNKAHDCHDDKPKLDPDDVVKAYMGKNEDDEDAEKGVATTAAKKVVGTAARAVAGTLTMANRTK